MSEIIISDAAKSHFEKALVDSKANAIRLGLKKYGCSGYAYFVDLAESKKDSEVVIESNGITIYVDSEYMKNFISGTTVDYVTDGLGSHVKFSNPKIENECGCGDSVHFKKET